MTKRDAASLARLVPSLAPETLHQIIRHRGLDECVELFVSATPQQLTSVLDLDLWRSNVAGRDERFDVERFGEWLEALVEAGDDVAARTVAIADRNLVIAGLSRYVRVVDAATFTASASSDDEPDDSLDARRVASSLPTCEVGGCVVQARRADAWDAIVALVVALDANHPECFHEIMGGCRRLSNSTPELDGLDNLLLERDQLMHDVASDREHRRSELGYSTPADARAFLEMARTPAHRRRDAASLPNPIAAAYFRAAGETEPTGTTATGMPQLAAASSAADEPALPPAAVSEVLIDEGFLPPRPRALVEGRGPEHPRFSHLRPLMAHLHDSDTGAYLERTRELAFLTNTLMAGCSILSRPFTPAEASEAVVSICNFQLERPAALPRSFLADHDLIGVFEAGWAALHEDVCLAVARRLIATLADLDVGDVEILHGLEMLRRLLVAEGRTGTPWRARRALDVIAMLDMPAWVSLSALLDECPVIAAALTATLDRRTTGVNAGEFEFIHTHAQLELIQAFMTALPAILRG